MDFRKLPSNSEGLLLKLVCSENPTQVLREQYNGLSTQQEQELDGIIRETLWTRTQKADRETGC